VKVSECSTNISKQYITHIKGVNNTFSARIRSPTSKVGNIDLDGMDLGSAREDL
jgi:hypothetical protein